jgi:hypothetical protein
MSGVEGPGETRCWRDKRVPDDFDPEMRNL